MAKLKLALLDLNNGNPNQGMRCLREITVRFENNLSVDEFDVRQHNAVPDLGYQIYLFSGGPGDPREGNGVWEHQLGSLIDDIWKHNQEHPDKKHVFFVCHSFQFACHHFGICEVNKRKATSFGIFPIHKTPAGLTDPLLQELDDPYYGVDSRDYQLVKPRKLIFERLGARILSREKIRTHVEFERAIMAIRFSPEIVGTQFHPEADPEGMKRHFGLTENKEKVISNYNEEKYQSMMRLLEDPLTIARTHDAIIPGFLKNAICKLSDAQIH